MNRSANSSPNRCSPSLHETINLCRNQYDTDVTTWSPQGRLHQVEYAMKAVELGSAAVGCVSKTHAVLVSGNTQGQLLYHMQSE